MIKARPIAVLIIVSCLLLMGFWPNRTSRVASGSSAITSNVVYLPFHLMNFNSGPGTVMGRVVDSSKTNPDGSPSPLENAVVCFYDACINTDVDGNYMLSDVPAGWRGISAAMDGFNPITSGVDVLAYQTTVLNFAMAPLISGENIALRIILTWSVQPYWGESIPNDLDAHLWMSSLLSSHIHSEYRGECTYYPNACLEVDYQRGFGPETIAIRKIEPNTTYDYGVLNYYQGYPGVPLITGTEAQVQIYDENGLLYSVSVPSSGDGDFWYIFSLDPVKGFQIKNCITYYNDNPPQCP